ncbi:cache domain-containing sensor histidine kinase [Paenibacillus glycanilyticus]|uniref:histidine kinase n=1 Tax=Paenibacillus glycanilyticus TaxID=126569 RepID=A0ABQ6GEU7_9BACL|nr:sensor histidine kinase [Paenibacillus glycanilyticus]GLX68605.1 sensor histidine kinase [Paenibacillus glycanilyticus]
MRRFISFKQKLIITYIVFIVLPLSVVGFGAYNLYRQAMENKLSDFAQQVAVSTSSNINNYFQELEKFTLQPYYNRDFQDLLTLRKPLDPLEELEKRETIEKNFSLWQSQRDNVAGIYYFDLPGTKLSPQIYSTGNPITGLTLASMPWYKDFDTSDDNLLFLSLHKPYFADAQEASIQNQSPVYSLVRKIYKSTTMLEYAGYLEVDFKLDGIKKIMDLVHLGESGSFFIVDGNGDVVYANDVIDDELLANLPSLSKDSQGKQHVNIGSKKNIVVHSKVGSYGWTVVGDVPVVQLASGSSGIRNSIILLVLSCIVIAILLSTWSSIQITKPIYILIALIKRVENEDFQISYANPPRNEIGHLIRSIIRMSKRLDETIRNLYQAEIVRKESELQALKSQINPHFLFNTLETIKMKAEIDEADSTVEMLTSLGKLVKASIYRGNDFTTFREEREYLTSYLRIQEGRFDTRFGMSIAVDESILDCYLPRLMIQPLIENAFYHGLELKQGKGTLAVAIRETSESVLITVADDGLGISAERLQQLREQLDSSLAGITRSSGSVGLANVHARMRLYFGDSSAMTIGSEPGTGTEIRLILPLIRSESEVHVYVSRHSRG